MHRVFVYGSLKRDYHNHPLLVSGGAKFIAETRTLETKFDMFALAGGGFPAVTRGDGAIKGELFEVDDATFRDLDRLEGNGHFYRRELIHLVGQDEPAWMYVIMHCDSRSRFNVDMDEDGDDVVLNWGDLRKIRPDDWLDYRSRRA